MTATTCSHIPKYTILGHAAAAVVTRPGAAVGHVEAAVEARGHIGVDDEDFEDEVEAVEAGLGVVPGWVGEGPRGRVVDADAESGPKRKEKGGAEEQQEPGAVPADAKFLGSAVGGTSDEGEGYNGNGEERKQCAEGTLVVRNLMGLTKKGLQESSRDEGDLPELQAHGRIQGEEVVHSRDDDHDQHCANTKVQECERQFQSLGPPKLGVVAAHDALGKDQVDDEQQQHAGLDKDARCDG